MLTLLALGIIGGKCWERGISDRALGSSVSPKGYSREFFGVGEPITLRSFLEEIDPDIWLEALRSLGVSNLREWTWMSALLLNETTINPASKEALDKVVLEAEKKQHNDLGHVT